MNVKAAMLASVLCAAATGYWYDTPFPVPVVENVNEFGVINRLIDVQLVDGEVRVIRKVIYPNKAPKHPVFPPREADGEEIWMDVYRASGDIVVRAKRVRGTIVPPKFEPERYEFGDEEDK